MQEEYTHLTKRFLVMELYHRGDMENSYEHPDDRWHKFDSMVKPKFDFVLAKFRDGRTEKVYVCERKPYWLYCFPGMRRPVITEQIVEWKRLRLPKEETNPSACKVYERPDGTSDYPPLEAVITDI